MNTSRISPVKERLFLLMMAVTIVMVAAVFVRNSRNALHPELRSGPRIDVRRVVSRIEEAGLEPREARYYRVME